MANGRCKVLALLAAYNEERFIENCLEHLTSQGIQVYLIDNESTDRTVERAEKYLGKGLLGIETLKRNWVYSHKSILSRKQQLAREAEADWIINLDPDEIRLAADVATPLPEAFLNVEAEGFNAIDFQEFTFVPTTDAPDHDHISYELTMRRYYAKEGVGNQIKAWKRNRDVDLISSAGHKTTFPGLKLYPRSFVMKHYMFLSVRHAIEKYCSKTYDPSETAIGWHVARASLRKSQISLPQTSDLLPFINDASLDASNPREKHWLFAPSSVIYEENTR